jgi:predicted small lipoprotein YifL
MKTVSNKFLIIGAVAVAALVVPGLGGPLMFGEAYAVSDKEQSNRANQNADDNVLNVQAVVQANVQDVNVCVIARDCN